MSDIVHNPVETSNQVLASDRAARPNLPMVGFNSRQVKQLGMTAVVKSRFLRYITAYFTDFLATH